ncbi:ABC transporter ATP-binding protein [Marivita sp.]|uniref:ABC transporter ATP-binding protein n=1 Tax=Marivita sp. TaxID=2003365 RepID=UPI003F6B0D1C
MTSLANYLEDFGTPIASFNAQPIPDEALENERLESFDKGYRAGWDDAIEAKTDESAQISDGIAQRLQEMSFTYHEVHAQVLSNLSPLFDEILQKILPVLARDTLGAHIADQLSAIARDIGTAQIEIAVASGGGAQVSQLLNAASISLPISVTEVAGLSDGQAELRLGRKELAIDLASVTAQITEAVHSALYEQSEMRAHG